MRCEKAAELYKTLPKSQYEQYTKTVKYKDYQAQSLAVNSQSSAGNHYYKGIPLSDIGIPDGSAIVGVFHIGWSGGGIFTLGLNSNKTEVIVITPSSVTFTYINLRVVYI